MTVTEPGEVVIRVSLFCCLAVSAIASGCASAVDVGGGSDLEETHHTFLDGQVLGAMNQPLKGIRVIVRFADGSSLPSPITTTDAAGDYTFVLAIYNGTRGVADSARATVYAFAAGSNFSSPGADHSDVLLRFTPVPEAPAYQRVNLRLPVY